jgi:hypothetical protein
MTEDRFNLEHINEAARLIAIEHPPERAVSLSVAHSLLALANAVDDIKLILEFRQ